ncbi:MAG TPA: ACT domain-containing protein [Candidatus Thiothrix moscowensis]|uniref:glycine cleavage system protein R n=1 Tax=unclassified Thiothrix TaxID=2636184 RepID=UPI0025D01AA0|nr:MULTISPECIES: ACT domain-containing protein [unclassified Thiothrix]HRJ54580.1 ACT domain-containing protein [Candidatus Thiothrix moscowensis]HRJ94954.1 ACT domain-containing protein [Candidatus Thiothrix moscowensis]
MQSSLVLTVLGPDRSGLVKSIAEAVKAHQGNWQESRMVHLAGQFAGLAHVTLPTAQVAALQQALRALQQDGLQVLLTHSDAAAPRNITPLTLELLGQDRPGIIHDITQQLAALNVNIEELESEQRAAPMSSELLFYAHLKLGLPDGVTAEDVQGVFENMPDPLTVDLSFS